MPDIQSRGFARRLMARAAFTLVELLIVVSIMCILLSMLMPVMASVRAQARGVVCQSNMRQIYMGIIGYTNDWNGCMMHDLNYDPSPGSYHWGAWGETWGNTIAVFLGVRTGGYPGGSQAEPCQYPSQLNIFRCPENGQQTWQMATGGGPTYTSYTGNGRGTLEQTFNQPWSSLVFQQEKFVKLQHINELMCFWDGGYYATEPWASDGLGCVPFTPVGARNVRYAHRGKTNIMYVDGHLGSTTLLQDEGASTPVSVVTPMRAASWTNGRAWWGQD